MHQGNDLFRQGIVASPFPLDFSIIAPGQTGKEWCRFYHSTGRKFLPGKVWRGMRILAGPRQAVAWRRHFSPLPGFARRAASLIHGAASGFLVGVDWKLIYLDSDSFPLIGEQRTSQYPRKKESYYHLRKQENCMAWALYS